MNVLRTPDDRFVGLNGHSFAPHYVEIPDGEGGKLRIHYLDEGPRQAPPIVCMHGQPTWSFLYRKMIPLLTAAGHRVIAPDLVGFGRSDKPASQDDYSYARHVGWMNAWFEALDLRDATLVCQDWGGLIGLRVVADQPGRFARVVAANTGLPDGTGIPADAGPALRALYETVPLVDMAGLRKAFTTPGGPPAFMFWQKLCADTPDLKIGEVVSAIALNPFPDDVLRAYDAPFPHDRYKAGARRFPRLVPIYPDDPAVEDNRRAWAALQRFEKPFLTAFSDADPVTAGLDQRMRSEIPGARGVEHVVIRGAGHFLQEDKPREFSDAILAFMAATPH